MLYNIAKFILRIFFRGYNRLKIHRFYHPSKNDAYIVVANHTSYLDPIYVGLAIPRKLHFMAKKESFKGLLKWLLLRLGAFPIDRSKPDIKAIKTALRLLKDGEVLSLFPQGTRKNDENLEELKQGAAYFAVKTKVPILPVYIKGADKVMPKGQVLIKPVKVEVFVGQPIKITDHEQLTTDQLIEETTNRIKNEINSLKLKA